MHVPQGLSRALEASHSSPQQHGQEGPFQPPFHREGNRLREAGRLVQGHTALNQDWDTSWSPGVLIPAVRRAPPCPSPGMVSAAGLAAWARGLDGLLWQESPPTMSSRMEFWGREKERGQGQQTPLPYLQLLGLHLGPASAHFGPRAGKFEGRTWLKGRTSGKAAPGLLVVEAPEGGLGVGTRA